MKKQKTHDVIVIGVGSMGAATFYHLAKQGKSVLGIERFNIVHKNGSHFGQSRIIRQAYSEHTTYVPLMKRAYELWEELNNLQPQGQKLLKKTGMLNFGIKQSMFTEAILTSAKAHKLKFEHYHYTLPLRYNHFNLPEGYEAIVESIAGYVLPEKTIRALVELGKAEGGEILEQTEVINWELEGEKVRVKVLDQTGKEEEYLADKIVLTAGAYVAPLLPKSFAPKLTVTKQILAWINTKPGVKLDDFPCWAAQAEGEEGIYYGLPPLSKEWLCENETGTTKANKLKLAHHLPSKENEVKPQDLPVLLDKELEDREKQKLENFMKRFLPHVFDGFVGFEQCLYTNTKDEHFIIDFVPNTNKQVVVGTGFSGHGFKFVPVIGEILADLATKGSTDLGIDFFSIDAHEQRKATNE